MGEGRIKNSMRQHKEQTTMKELAHYMEAFASLHTAQTKGRKAPHKAVLLLAVIDQIEQGRMPTPYIGLTEELIECFAEIWNRYVGASALWRLNICQPYYHMQHESFWRLVERDEVACGRKAEPEKLVGARKERKDLPRGGYTVKAMREAFVYAEMDGALFGLLQDGKARAMLRAVLINTYLTDQPTKTKPRLDALMAALPLVTLVA